MFDTIAKGYHAINMPDLITYLERNSFFPRREDVEAILRRCDHDGNRVISYAEFCEISGVVEAGERQEVQVVNQNQQPNYAQNNAHN